MHMLYTCLDICICMTQEYVHKGSHYALITAVALQLSGHRVWVKDDSVRGKDTVRIKDVKTGQLPLKM